MTQYEIELIQEAQNRKWEKEKRVEIFTINTLMRMFSKNAKAISWINLLGIFKKKLKQVTEFENVEEYFEYLKKEGVKGIVTGKHPQDRKSTRLNSSHSGESRMTSSA